LRREGRTVGNFRWRVEGRTGDRDRSRNRRDTHYRPPLPFIRRRRGAGGLPPRAARCEVGLAALGQNLRLLDPVLLIDAALEPQSIPDALDVGLHPGGDLLIAANTELVEAGLELGIDQSYPLQVLRRCRLALLDDNGCGSWSRPRQLARGPRLGARAAAEPIRAGRALRRLGKRIDPALGDRHGAGDGKQAAPDEAGQRRAEEVGCPHQQQRLHEQRNHHSTPNAARGSRLSPLWPVARRPAAGQPADHQADRECNRQPPEQLVEEIVHLPLVPAVPTLLYFGRTMNSIRRFFAMLSLVSLGAMGRSAP
jgi:hypothetical protein